MTKRWAGILRQAMEEKAKVAVMLRNNNVRLGGYVTDIDTYVLRLESPVEEDRGVIHYVDVWEISSVTKKGAVGVIAE
jgi:hypothetical protein